MKSKTYEEPKWRVRGLLELLGPYNKLSSDLADRGYPKLPEGTISAWASRNSIPAPWLPAVIELALDGRLIGSINDLREKRHVGTDEGGGTP